VDEINEANSFLSILHSRTTRALALDEGEWLASCLADLYLGKEPLVSTG
jgi:hypothetical protein